ncbi:bifunctional aldolase/short-chain dehydrogenase [Chlorobaculum sp. MV4-Y]|uniref:bifunctional aldolase/short-chain dehydrogenase n=1 Tax=Chlorobaculum sp. MV4-Y TaxID=2976335 RepID=UPI0021B003EB|nr:bifunctional aldolase/short-chain dehydrogenase [Chlorobaculum sp. MV4-Y]UWX57184.1 bifunctional aldolase/short-chain dehydrogenase [Chlorobaculum sp. MV4-Y]
MKNLWNESDLNMTAAGRIDAADTPAELVELVYASRLLGKDDRLVMHGGGNTSVKCELTDFIGNHVNVIFIKASGVNLASVDAGDFTPVRIDPLRKLQKMYESGQRHSEEDIRRFSTREFKNFLFLNLFTLTDRMVSRSLSPSIETLLHAFLPHRYIMHTHSLALLTLSNQTEGERLCREALGDDYGQVPYIQPGLGLANLAHDAYEANPSIEGLVLHKHGLVTFGDSAKEAYDRMIDGVNRIEERIASAERKSFAVFEMPAQIASVEEVAPIVRGACSFEKTPGEKDYQSFVLEFRTSPALLDYLKIADLEAFSKKGAMTPDFIIRTKNHPLVAPAPDAADLEGFGKELRARVERFTEEYRAYFECQQAATGMSVSMIDPMPRVVLVPGLGLFGLGRSVADAKLTADIAEHSAVAMLDAESIGCFESISEKDAFEIEYWDMEQAKVRKSHNGGEFAGKVALVTGGAGAIGLATAKAFKAKGAEIVIMDLDSAALEKAADELGPGTLTIPCDVTNAAAVREAFDLLSRTFGGLDIVVSNVGVAWQGRIGDVSDDLLRRSFELNFFSHQTISQNAVRVMRRQGTGGVLLYNVSKQAVNPGPDFGPYGLPKAATLFLLRQYALDHGRDGIRANGVNADRIRSGLLTPEMIKARSAARGLSEKDYMAGNLLGLEVSAEDVADAFVHLALETKTTGSITTVDGGNIAAALR